jgi:NTP pyrophosphatase (non-canonical NTP hydrolase)
MTKEQRFINLVEEVGELANAIAIAEKHKSPKRKRSDLRDSFADTLYNLIILASLYDIDLEDEMNFMLDGLEKRIHNHDFDDE